jgi:ABC-type taurine transport system substrate-binding protein
MAAHLLAAGHPLSVYNRSADKTAALVAKGAQGCATPAQVAQKSDVIITMVGYPSDVEQVWLGAEGIIAHASHALLIDMTTSSPALASIFAELSIEPVSTAMIRSMRLVCAEIAAIASGNQVCPSCETSIAVTKKLSATD